MVNPVSLEARVTFRSVPSDTRPAATPGTRFADILGETMEASRAVRVSAHAAQRLRTRGVELSAEDLARVGETLDQLAGKGGKEALVLLGDVALVASVPNRTIITAVDTSDGNASIFTHIDSAAVLPTSEAEHRPDRPEARADTALNSVYGPDPLRDARAPRNDRRGAMT